MYIYIYIYIYNIYIYIYNIYIYIPERHFCINFVQAIKKINHIPKSQYEITFFSGYIYESLFYLLFSLRKPK